MKRLLPLLCAAAACSPAAYLPDGGRPRQVCQNTFSSIGVPGTNGFVGEFLIITGTFNSAQLSNFSGIHMVGAAAGVILAAV